MRIFLDANILFSAAKSDGAIRALLALLHERQHVLWADAYVVEEARRNLVAKGRAALGELEVLLCQVNVAALQRWTTLSQDDVEEEMAWLPEKDRPVLQAAIALGCDALVTGDRRHFGPGYGRTIRGVTLYSPRGLAERILG